MQSVKVVPLNSHPCPVDSSLLVSKFNIQKASNEKGKGSGCSHPIQSVFLGSDRRYNRYWLFLGPCNADDPGHRRVYFESSEDGHWEVIDTEEVNFIGLLVKCGFKLFPDSLDILVTWNNKQLNMHIFVGLVCLMHALFI